jgi:hypothetical protein
MTSTARATSKARETVNSNCYGRRQDAGATNNCNGYRTGDVKGRVNGSGNGYGSVTGNGNGECGGWGEGALRSGLV